MRLPNDSARTGTLPFGVGVAIGIDLGRPAVGGLVLRLPGDVSRIGSNGSPAIPSRLACGAVLVTPEFRV
jgi:hypothetical protein